MKTYEITPELLNAQHIQILGYSDGVVQIELSPQIRRELAEWPRKKRKDVLDDIKTSVKFTGMLEQMTAALISKIYDTVLCTLSQIY